MAYTYGNYGYAKDSNGNYITLNGNYIYQIRLGYQVNSQDIENNRSNISLQLEVRSVNSSYKTYGYNQTTTIDGTTLSAKSFDFRSTNTWQIFGTRTFDVTHNADGTYSVEKSASFTTTATGTGRPHSGSASVQVTLPTIPRASSITVSDANIGSSTNIVINKASSSFTTTLEYSTNNSTWTTIVSKTSNQVYGWTVPTSFYSLIPNAKTMTCYFRATTYSGNTNVGIKTTTATFTATGNPVINSSSATDVNSTTTALTGNSANMVRYASNVQVSVNVSGQNSATVSSVTVNGSSVSLSGTNPKTGSITFNSATTNSFEIKVTDSRGYQTTTTKTMTMVNYVSLSINANIKRNQPTDGKVNVSASGNYFNASFGSQSNTLTVQYRYKESTSSSWGSWTNLSTTLSGNTYSGSTQLSNMDYTKQYNFEIRATDKVGTKSITGITVSKGEPIYWWDNDEFNINGNSTIRNSLIVGSVESKNIFDEVWINGTINSGNGSVDSTYSSYSITNVNLIPVKPNTTYTISFSGGNYVIDRLATFNSSKTFISRSASLNQRTFTTNSNTYYIRFNVWSDNGMSTSSVGNTQLEKGSIPTSYSPYQNLDYASENRKNIKLIYTKDIGGNTTDTYTFPTTTSLYLVIAHQNGSQYYCIFDIVYGRGQYYTRIKDVSSSPVSITISYSSGQISCSCIYGTKLAIIELPFVE